MLLQIETTKKNEQAAPDAAIDVRGLVKTYPGGMRALNGLSFSVECNRIVALVGPNGAGKSTTMRILTTRSRADAGDAEIMGIGVSRDPHAVRRMIGCVMQRSSADPDATGRENLTLQGRLHGRGGKQLQRRVDELLDRFHLMEHANRLARTYSGGMQRKLDIALGLIHEPSVLFLDEPTTGLDPKARADLWDDIGQLPARGVTILLTTHYLEEADRLADRVVIIDRGRIVAEGTPEQLKTDLRGDSVEIELMNPASEEVIGNALSGIGAVRDVKCSGNSIRARVESGAAMIPALLLALESRDIRVASVKVARPTLDDVYLRHTGRTFQQTEEDGTK